MLRSMYAGISGMKGSQTNLDVIGNNIANVNTEGFKKGRVTFQDLMSQMSSGAEGPTDTRGGTNAKQVGLGAQEGSIDDLHTQGHRETTDNPLDLEIEGDGMFALASDPNAGVDEGDVTDTDAEDRTFNFNDVDKSYTRAGNFSLDDAGNIVNSDGLYVVGFATDKDGNIQDGDDGSHSILNIPEDAKSFSIEESGQVNYVNENGDTEVAGQVALANFSNPEGLEKMETACIEIHQTRGCNVKVMMVILN